MYLLNLSTLTALMPRKSRTKLPPVYRPVFSVVSKSLLCFIRLLAHSCLSDHTIEIQILDSVAQKSGLCTVISTLLKADPTLQRTGLLSQASVDISAAANLNFLDGTVNNRVSHASSLNAQRHTDVDFMLSSG